jgi:hypothetical protein
MLWKCPACNSELFHAHTDDLPHPGVVYRCCICRLELIFDPYVMTLRPAAPFPPDEKSHKRRNVA